MPSLRVNPFEFLDELLLPRLKIQPELLQIYLLLGRPEHKFRKALCFTCNVFFLFLFAGLPPSSVSQSLQNFATWSQYGCSLQCNNASPEIRGALPPKKLGAKNIRVRVILVLGYRVLGDICRTGSYGYWPNIFVGRTPDTTLSGLVCRPDDKHLVCIISELSQAELTFIHNCWYPQFELLISTIPIIDISN